MAKSPILRESDNGSSLELAAGETVLIEFAENPTTGYRWAIAPGDGKVIAIATDDFSPGDGIGAGGQRRIRLKALAAGRTTVTCRLVRSWAADQPLNTIAFDIVVTP